MQHILNKNKNLILQTFKFLIKKSLGLDPDPDSAESLDPVPPHRAHICKPFKEPRNRFPACGPVTQPYLPYRPARLRRLAESIPGLLKRLQIRAMVQRV
jgi:hypothetical protein